MQDTTLWWLLAGSLVALEMVTGSFYLLMLALGLVAGALAAHGGWSLAAQVSAAGLIGAAAVAACYLIRRPAAGAPSVRRLRSVNLDIGEVVQVDAWLSDGSARVHYRGAQWTVIPAHSDQALTAGPHRVVELQGNRLVVEKVEGKTD
jgi:membrane protein implicated in regulation of membrane protease activity